MEIIYLYIKEFKNIKDQNINFGSEYQFTFNGINKLSASKNELYIENFYNIRNDGAQVTNVTSIIGENGTGKSSILDFIRTNFPAGTNLTSESILITKDNEEITIYSTFENLNYDQDLFRYKFINNPSKNEPINFGFNFRGIDNTDIIYFSNIFDGASGGSLNGLYDISTNGLIFEDYRSDLEQGIITREQNQIEVFLTKDIFRQLKFVTHDISNEKIPFNIPDVISIEILEILNTFDKNKTESKTFSDFQNVINEHYLYDDQYDANFSTVRNLHPINSLVCSILLNLVKELITLTFDSKLSEFRFASSFKLINGTTLIQYTNIETRVTHFFEQINKQINLEKSFYPQLFELIDNNKIFITFLLDNKDHFFNSYINPNSRVLHLDISEDKNFKEKLLKEFVSLYLKTFSVNPYLNFKWRNLSSGENALLNVFSRFYSLANERKFGEPLKQNIIILIDEGDTYLHPSWQKRLLKILLEFLPMVFIEDRIGRKRNLQVIFTTNSPIPASDLLNYNTIFLEKTHNGAKVKDSLNEQKNTFAANIHTLLSDSFFISDGLRGEFANEKLQLLIKFLKEDKNNEAFDQKSAFKLISLIGEPLIQNSLKDLFFIKFPSAIELEIERLTALKNKYDLNR